MMQLQFDTRYSEEKLKNKNKNKKKLLWHVSMVTMVEFRRYESVTGSFIVAPRKKEGGPIQGRRRDGGRDIRTS